MLLNHYKTYFTADLGEVKSSCVSPVSGIEERVRTMLHSPYVVASIEFFSTRFEVTKHTTVTCNSRQRI